jgi:hypothetical protein
MPGIANEGVEDWVTRACEAFVHRKTNLAGTPGFAKSLKLGPC